MDLHLCQPLVKDLLSWFHKEARILPWRVLGRNHPTPYHVWLSEIMLQQTTVTTVQPYFKAFIERWPTLKDLAAACEDDLLTQWQGLGYYSRARNLHKAAQVLLESYQGAFPQDLKALEKLPGVGPYTAAALGAIAFDLPVVPVDGNIARVYARLCRLETSLPDLLSEVRCKAQCLAREKKDQEAGRGFHHGDLAQALMDLGARLCTPKKPACDVCPIRSYCKTFQVKDPECFPFRKPKPFKPTKYATAFYLENEKGALWLQKRPDSGLLARMMEVPSTPWEAREEESEGESEKKAGIEAKIEAPFPSLDWSPCPGLVKHTFTHFHLRVTVMRAVAPASVPLPSGNWYLPETLEGIALPTLMKKIIQQGQRFFKEQGA